MSAVTIQKVKAMPKWAILPIVFSLVTHLLIGGTLPYYLGSGLKTFHEEINKRFQPVTVRSLQPVTIKKVEKVATDKSMVTRKTPDIEKFVEEISPELKPFKDSIEKNIKPDDLPLSSPLKKKWMGDDYKVVSRRGDDATIGQDMLGSGSRYAQRQIIKDRVARFSFGSSKETGAHSSGKKSSLNRIDEQLLKGKGSFKLDFKSTFDTPLSKRQMIRRSDADETVGFLIPLTSEDIKLSDNSQSKLFAGVPALAPPLKKKVLADGTVIYVPDELSIQEAEDPRFILAEPLEPEVETDFKVFREPDNPNSYFRLSIKVKENSKLPVIRKNILFVIDISLSVTKQELAEVRKAIGARLNQLHPEDRFNVVRFSEKVQRAFFNFVSPTNQHIEAAMKFVNKVPGQIKTNVYRVLHSAILNIFTRFRPCQVFLISDGVSTQGVRDAQKIVREIAPVTRSNISIYTIDVGQKGNQYLLDLVAYRSRGKMLRIENLQDTKKKIIELSREIDHPVLMNLGIHYVNLRVDEIYPQVLPNLYQDQELVIYGQCEPGRQCAIQILGQAKGFKWKKFIYPMSVPQNSNGDASIAREWARGKIHYLVARLARNAKNPSMVAEIVALGKKYNLPVPFGK